MRYIPGIIFLSSIIFWSCEETVYLDLDQMESRVVIEGLVTNQSGHQYVKVSMSNGFYDDGKTPRVTDATVIVKDNLNNEYVFVHNPRNHTDSAGYYIPSVNFKGLVGRTYHLVVTVNGTTYEAEDYLNPVTSIDSLKYQVNENEKDEPKTEGKFYEVLMFAKEPQQSTDYYLFKFYRNDTLIYHNPSDIYYTDDKTLGEAINGVPSPVYYAPEDSARVEMYSLSRVGFVFYNDLSILINNDGGMFSPPPANCRSNLSNGALGFFQVSAVDISGIKIKE